MSGIRWRLQQQPVRVVDKQQQQSSGSNEFQPRHAQPVGQICVNQADGTGYKSRQDYPNQRNR